MKKISRHAEFLTLMLQHRGPLEPVCLSVWLYCQPVGQTLIGRLKCATCYLASFVKLFLSEKRHCNALVSWNELL